MAQTFTAAQWRKIHGLVESDGEAFGLPARHGKSVVIGSFNIRKLGKVSSKSANSWKLLLDVAERFDLLAVQEVQDDLEGVRLLRDELNKRTGNAYGLVVSDITGGSPKVGMKERLAFLFRWAKIARTEVASDISYDRSWLVKTLYEQREPFWISFDAYEKDLRDWEKKAAERKSQGKKAPKKPSVHLPDFVSFIRQPLCVSFAIQGVAGHDPHEFLAVNAHLLFGDYEDERYKEFQALVGWLVDRARKSKNMYCPNVIMLGDCNLNFKNPETSRNKINAFLKFRNSADLSGKPAKLNFPFLDVHPARDEVFRTNARLNQTYDQVGLVSHDAWVPRHEENVTAGQNGTNGYDYGVFNFVDLFANALHGKNFSTIAKDKQKDLLKKFEHDFTDHMPIWIRLPKPGA